MLGRVPLDHDGRISCPYYTGGIAVCLQQIIVSQRPTPQSIHSRMVSGRLVEYMSFHRK